MNEASTDHGTVIGPRDCAIVIQEDGQPVLLVPQYETGAIVPEHLLELTAMYVRWMKDEDWRADLNRWFREHPHA